VAGVLEGRLRDTDIPGRWGGDEFMAVLPGTGAPAAVGVAEDLAGAVRAIAEFPELTLSIGCAAWDDDDPAELVARADQALYEVKRRGRDGVALARPRAV
jgi:diguanylate cyclase (GGDEF)-like protein